MKIMGIDYGDARTGVSICDEMEMLASPVTVVSEWNEDKCAQRIAEIAAEHKPALIIVGLPLNMNGTEGPRAQKCREFADKLNALTAIETKMWDERSTTVTAHSYLNDTNTRGKKRKAVVDAVAAVIILESYLSHRKNAGGGTV